MSGLVNRARIHDVAIGDYVLVDHRWHRVTFRPYTQRLGDLRPKTPEWYRDEAAYVVALDHDEPVVIHPRTRELPRIPAPVLEALAAGARDPYRT